MPTHPIFKCTLLLVAVQTLALADGAQIVGKERETILREQFVGTLGQSRIGMTLVLKD